MDFESIQSDLKFIREVVNNNRKVFIDNGLMFISSGIFVAIGVLMNYAMYAMQLQDYLLYSWGLWIILVISTNIFLGSRHQTRLGKKTFASEMFGNTWLACGIPIIIFFLVFISTGNPGMPAFVAAAASMLGIAYYLTGFITDFNLMKILAFGWWVGALLALLWEKIGNYESLGLLFALMVFLFEVIPGIVIYRKWIRIYNG